MCGPSDQEKQLNAEESKFSNMLMGNYADYFGKQSAVLDRINNYLTPIAEAGPTQQGWAAPEVAAVNTQIGEGTGGNYAKAAQALGNQLSAEGGGNAYLPNGAANTLKAQVATAAAAQQSSESLAATEANYAQGHQNWEQATAGLQELGNQYSPSSMASEATSANQSAFGQADKIQQENNQLAKDIAGGITGLAGGALDFANGSDFMGQLGGGQIFGPGGILNG